MFQNVIYKNELKKLELAEAIWKIYIMENGDYIAINVYIYIITWIFFYPVKLTFWGVMLKFKSQWEILIKRQLINRLNVLQNTYKSK